MASVTWKGGKLLLALADFLENDPRVKGHFNMSTIVDARMKGARPDLAECGSAACAMGWAPHVPAIRRAGLAYRAHSREKWAYLTFDGEWQPFRDLAVYTFDISYSAAGELFLSRPRNHTPKQVARNIRRFVTAERKRRGINADA